MSPPVHSQPYSLPPWSAPGRWLEANRSLDRLISGRTEDLSPARGLARRIRRLLDAVDPWMDELAARTCPGCPSPCCAGASVYHDFTDLVVLHLAGPGLPLEQCRAAGETCRHLSPSGCLLPREIRPWICTWYLCPEQRRELSRLAPDAERRLTRLVTRIGRLRPSLEELFIAAVTTGRGASPPPRHRTGGIVL